jgi:hypothetical protein
VYAKRFTPAAAVPKQLAWSEVLAAVFEVLSAMLPEAPTPEPSFRSSNARRW